MKGSEAIAKTRQKLETEFNERKARKLEGLKRHKEELEAKIAKLQQELNSVTIKMKEVEDEPFRANQLSLESRTAQSKAAKQRNHSN